MNEQRITIDVNGAAVAATVEPRELLVHFLREQAGLTGTHIGCDTTQCGACTVAMDGRTVKSCTVLAAQAQGHQVTTIEGVSSPQRMTPLQQAFNELHALQCGFCTPGMVFAAQALLDRVADPTEAQVRDALHGNLCRCTGYQNIVDAVLLTARRAKELQ
ncbi:MAG: (2Fe-2S)-binding protein [Ramlibacter sp.]|nr:(2Fe-2S)-binding protein [Ramlibacter sp.]